ncbi:MAG: hypothetical protein AB1297_08365, partial [bacterium]
RFNIYKGEKPDEAIILKFLQNLKTKMAAYSSQPKISLCVERDMIYKLNEETWKEIDRLVAQYKLLLYDYNRKTKRPASPAPLPEIKDDVRRFLQIVYSPEKVILGVIGYGFLWIQKDGGDFSYQGSVWYNKGTTFTKASQIPIIVYLERMKNGFLPSATGKIVNWDEYSKTPYLAFYSNNKRYEVWYEDKESLSLKIKEVVQPFNLKGIALWQLGMEEDDWLK